MNTRRVDISQMYVQERIASAGRLTLASESGADIGRRLGVSRRTVTRYRALLRARGVLR